MEWLIGQSCPLSYCNWAMVLAGELGVLGIRTARLRCIWMCLERLRGAVRSSLLSEGSRNHLERVQPVHIAPLAVTVLRLRGYNGKWIKSGLLCWFQWEYWATLLCVLCDSDPWRTARGWREVFFLLMVYNPGDRLHPATSHEWTKLRWSGKGGSEALQAATKMGHDFNI